MATDEPKYVRLTGARPRSRVALVSSGNSSLWLGPDHVLCIDTNGYTESYKRFYFRDIQAILIRRTDAYKYWSLVLVVAGGAFALPAILLNDTAGKIALFIIAGVFFLFLVFNLAFGPTSACHLRTAVQVEALPSLNRLRRARKVLSRLRPLIAGAQGVLTPEELALRFQGFTGPATTPAAPADGASPAQADPNLPPRISS